MLKLRREAVIKEAVKFDVEPKELLDKEDGKCLFGLQVSHGNGLKGNGTYRKKVGCNDGDSKHLRKTPTCNGLTKLLKVY